MSRGKVRTAIWESFPEPVKVQMRNRRAEFRGLGQVKLNQAMLAKKLAELELREQGSVSAPDEVPDPNFPAHVRSRLCTQAQLGEPWYAKWCSAFAEPPLLNRKLWEFAYIAEVLESMGMLQSGRRGLGFGVGREPLVPLFAHHGAELVATDLGADSREVLGWARTGQHSDSIEAMQRPEICDPEQFRRLVTFRPVDMREIPPDLKGFDFCWSSCAFEHLGTLEDGLTFVERSVDTLAPGGIAVHTTEYNCDSDDATVEDGPTVVYRQRDVRSLVQRLESAGHQVAALDLSQGDGLLDRYVDTPPYVDEPCLRRWYLSYTITSLALVIRARA